MWPRADPVPRGAMPPASARPPPSAPRSLRPPPVAAGASARPPPPPPPPAPPRLSSTPRCVPIPAPTSAVAAPTSQVTTTDKPGRALHRAPGCPLPTTHTRRPLGPGAYKQGGAAREHPRRAGVGKEAGRRGGREADIHPANHPPPGAQQPLRLLDLHPARSVCARAARTCLPTAGFVAPARALVQPCEWASGVMREGQGWGAVAVRLTEPSPFFPTFCLSHVFLSKAAVAQKGRAI